MGGTNNYGTALVPRDFDDDTDEAERYGLVRGSETVDARPVRRGFGRVGRDHAVLRELQRKADAVDLAAIDAWLRDCPRLPPARVPNFESPMVRR